MNTYHVEVFELRKVKKKLDEFEIEAIGEDEALEKALIKSSEKFPHEQRFFNIRTIDTKK